MRRGWIARRATAVPAVAAIGIVVLLAPVQALAGEQPFEAVDLDRSKRVYFLNNRAYGMTQVLIRGTAGTTWCYTLDPDARPSLPAKYRPVNTEVIRINYFASMAWIADTGPSVGNPLTPFYPDEVIAEQIAIWSYAKGGKLTRETVPNIDLRRRAKELRAAAAAVDMKDNLNYYFIGLKLEVNIVKSTYDKVVVEASLRDERGEAVVGKTIRILWNGVEIRKADTDSSGIVNVSMPRPDRLVTLAAEWPNANYGPGMYLVPDDPRKPVLISNEVLDIIPRTETRLDPASLTSGPQLLYQTLNDGLTRIFGTAGQKAAAAIVLLALAGPYVVGIITVLRTLIRWRRDPRTAGSAAITQAGTDTYNRRAWPTRPGSIRRRRIRAAHEHRTFLSGD
jgi:hypothetical protein